MLVGDGLKGEAREDGARLCGMGRLCVLLGDDGCLRSVGAAVPGGGESYVTRSEDLRAAGGVDVVEGVGVVEFNGNAGKEGAGLAADDPGFAVVGDEGASEAVFEEGPVGGGAQRSEVPADVGAGQEEESAVVEEGGDEALLVVG